MNFQTIAAKRKQTISIHTRLLSTTIILLLFANNTIAQSAAPVIEAEKAFAQMARTETMRKAFVKNLDSSGVIFNAGAVHNGLQQFSAAPESGIRLLWHPAYACLSSSGDIGFTTGPFEVRKTMESAALAAGQYSSVWKKNKQGEWKLLVDLGIDYRTSLYTDTVATASFSGLVPANVGEWSEVEASFIKAYNEKGVTAFHAVVRDGSWFNLQGRHPLRTKAAIQESLKTLPGDLVFHPLGTGASTARDMVYVYGAVEHQGKKENYLRIWAHTKQGWILLLQVIKW